MTKELKLKEGTDYNDLVEEGRKAVNSMLQDINGIRKAMNEEVPDPDVKLVGITMHYLDESTGIMFSPCTAMVDLSEFGIDVELKPMKRERKE